LVVDDERDVAERIRDLLQRGAPGRYAVEWAGTFETGLASLREGGHDIALIDYRLDSANGLDLLQIVKGENCGVPCLMLTQADDDLLDAEALAAGAVDCLAKEEISAPLIQRMLRSAINHQRGINEARQRGNYFHALIESAPDAILVVGADHVVRFATNSAESVTGRRVEDLIGRDSFDLVEPDDQPIAMTALGECLRTAGSRRTVEYRARRADGSVRHREAVLVNCLDEPGVNGVVVNLRDITDRKRVEAQRPLSVQSGDEFSPPHVQPKQRPVQMLRATLRQSRVTPREAEIIQGLIRYRRLSRVAQLLGISVHTVRNHLKSIFRKLNLHSQDELLAFLEDESPGRADM
jgi:PAS domain S-box-containing protein